MSEKPTPGRTRYGSHAEIGTHRRAVIERVRPEINAGAFAIKRVIGDRVVVEADVFADGRDHVACRIVYWSDRGNNVRPDPHYSPMMPSGEDRWRGEFRVSELGAYRYTIEAWIDRFQSWRSDLVERIAAKQDVRVDLLIGADILADAAKLAAGPDAEALQNWSRRLREPSGQDSGASVALEEGLLGVIERYPDPNSVSRYERDLPVVVDRVKARFSTWYEVFPRSCSPEAGRHGTLRDCEEWLACIAAMGFDVLYLPPVHPVGTAFRKGKNNSPEAQPGDVGSPWAIGSSEGGHKAVHPQLGTLQDFRHFVAAAAGHGLEIALDIAFQCSPDHPYVREHPEWFRKRPDGTIQYAENPPKKYQDIYPLNFETPESSALWEELRSVFEFWIGEGVHIFRVDNPHTKAFPFWQWVIAEIKSQHPGVIFLAEAFTRPQVMYWLAKLGFSQSYTYFTWRNTKRELTEYFTELTRTEVREYFRPNLWPNTPDILHEFLQAGGRPAFMIRVILAATLGASYGIYGPAFELCENAPQAPGSEEYLHSEKYELKHRDRNASWSLKDFIARINRIRRENSPLQNDHSLRFHETDNPLLLCYSKAADDQSSVIIVVVNLDPIYKQTGWLQLDLSSLGIDAGEAFQADDLLGGGRYLWQGGRNYVELTPQSLPAHIVRVRREAFAKR